VEGFLGLPVSIYGYKGGKLQLLQKKFRKMGNGQFAL
jgi:hypothetical protein